LGAFGGLLFFGYGQDIDINISLEGTGASWDQVVGAGYGFGGSYGPEIEFNPWGDASDSGMFASAGVEGFYGDGEGVSGNIQCPLTSGSPPGVGYPFMGGAKGPGTGGIGLFGIFTTGISRGVKWGTILRVITSLHF
jgi:hypothetical protein